MMHKWTARVSKLLLAGAIGMLSIVGGAMQASAAETAANLDLVASSAILVEASTGKVLYSKNPDQPLPPASMTKMMTEYLVLEAIKKGKIKQDELVPVSDYAFFIAKKKDSSGVYLNAGESHKVSELYKAMAIASANDATALLAEKIGGTEANFVDMMNKKAQEIGMKNTFFVTSTGLPANELGPYKPADTSKDNVMSARDAAILADRLVSDYPEALEISKIPRWVFREGQKEEIKLANNNWMLPGLPNETLGVDGLKTGYTDAAQFCFTGTAYRDGMRLITVVMGAKTKTSRFEETKKLLNYGYSTYKATEKLGKGVPVPGFENAPLKKGVSLEVPAITAKSVNVVGKIGEEAKVTPRVEYKLLTAPIKKGDVIGTVYLDTEGKSDYLMPSNQKGGVDLIAAEDVEEGSWIRLFFRSIFEFIANLFKSIVG
ncbi:D-alanyl-D-alanine carboxypeptidase family protein [Brevibacillus laterosporus]|uniref:D-alanyl-D-alanine carboxypeptidase family protein n=1 Tax=Brevibacillus laterosporus TaxID=1465 RepID=UPI000839C3A1|nr:D-alanyl-D-alanine carboxypeptidase family protein [Brevibacillus laterosporus]